MKYCEAASDRFVLTDDPWDNGRVCYKNKYDFFERIDLVRIIEDPKFLFIKGDIVYFDN